jgi:hypothetical protein
MHQLIFISLSVLIPPLVVEAMTFLATRRTARFSRWLRSPVGFAFAAAVATFLICSWIGVFEGCAMAFIRMTTFCLIPEPIAWSSLPAVLWQECQVFAGLNALAGIGWSLVAGVRVWSRLSSTNPPNDV